MVTQDQLKEAMQLCHDMNKEMLELCLVAQEKRISELITEVVEIRKDLDNLTMEVKTKVRLV